MPNQGLGATIMALIALFFRKITNLGGRIALFQSLPRNPKATTTTVVEQDAGNCNFVERKQAKDMETQIEEEMETTPTVTHMESLAAIPKKGEKKKKNGDNLSGKPRTVEELRDPIQPLMSTATVTSNYDKSMIYEMKKKEPRPPLQFQL